MKKIVYVILLCLMSFSLLTITGCNETNYSKADVSDAYNEIKNTYCNANGYLTITIDYEKVMHEAVLEDDQCNIFPSVYNYFLQYSSGIFFGKVARQDKDISVSIDKFSQEQLNIMYSKLKTVSSNLASLEQSKDVYEDSDGYLYFEELINCYKVLLANLYSLSDSFVDFYIRPFYNYSMTSSILNTSSISDMLWYELYLTSLVPYKYNLLNVETNNYSGSILYELNNYIGSTENTVNRLMTNSSLIDNITGSEQTNILNIFNNFFSNEDSYLTEYNLFTTALTFVPVKNYLYAVNQTAYLVNCSAQQRSCFDIINNFLDNRFNSFCAGISQVYSYINT